jgi:thiol-disulfide isomerase/thioredoxin
MSTFVAVAFLTGCQQAPQPEPAAPRASPASEAPRKPAEVTLDVVDQAGFEQALAKSKGKVVLVDFWATWCTPCKKAFPHTVALAGKYAPQGLEVISVSMDDDAAHEEALAFLKEQQATFNNLRSKWGAEEEAIEKFEIDGGGLPHLKLYDRQGKLVKKFTSGDPDAVFSQEDVELAVRQLVTQE